MADVTDLDQVYAERAELDHWYVIRKDSHDRLAEFSDYDDALDFATELHATTGVTVMAMTGHNVPDEETTDDHS